MIKRIPISGPYSGNVDDDAVTDPYSSLLQDVFVDEAPENAVNRRPGGDVKDEEFGYGAATQGAYEWKQKGFLVFVQGGKIFTKRAKNTIPQEVTGATLHPTNRVYFAFNGTHLVMVNGSNMVWTTDGITATQMAHASAPTDATHVGFIDGYIIANSGDKVYRSALDDALTWNAAWNLETESIPDTITAVFVSDSKIFAWGPSNLEIWYNAGLSGGTPFARQQVIERGLIAPDSVIRANNTFYWLNEERRFVFLNGSVVQSISLPVDKEFANMTTVSDAFTTLWRVGGRYFIVLTFPTEDKSWAYDVILDRWYKWGYWSTSLGKYKSVPYSTMTYMQAWGIHIAGSTMNDKLYQMALDSYGDGTNKMRSITQTGWIDHGVSVRKKCSRVRLTVKRGAVTLDSSDLTKKPKLIVQHRSDGKKAWSNEREIDLGGIGDTVHHVDINRLGSFRTRQWKFELSDLAPLVLVKAEVFLDFGRD